MKKNQNLFFDYKDLWPVWIDRDRQYESQEVEFLVNSTHWIFYDNKKTK
jgi:hypothetical protein